MTCEHVFKGMCGCPPEVAPPVAPPSLVYENGRKKTMATVLRERKEWQEANADALEVARDAALEGRMDAVAEIAEGLDLDEFLTSEEAARVLLKELDASLARASLSEFIRQGWHVIEPATELEWNWHHELICAVVQGMFEDWLRTKSDPDFIQRVINAVFSVPPGSLKSRILSVFFPVWAWLHAPGWKVICLSVNQDASFRDGRASRDIIRSTWFRDLFNPTWALKDDQDSISNYGNTAGGERISRAQGSEIVGLRADAIIIDDPNNPKESENKVEREKVNDLWTTNIFNRVNDMIRSLRIGVQQRTNAGDWTGYVLKLDGAWSDGSDGLKPNPRGWLHVVLPAEYEEARKCRTPWGDDPRTEEGESIHKKRLTPEVLEAERARFGLEKYAGQMQQRPALVEGGRIKRAWWRFCTLASLDGSGFEWDEIPLMPWEGEDPGVGEGPADSGEHVETAGEAQAREDREAGVEVAQGVLPALRGTSLRPRPNHCPDRETAPAYRVGPASQRAGWDFDWVVIGVDPASKKTKRGSNWGILVVGGKGQRFFVLADHTQRGEYVDILKVLKKLVVAWRPDRILIEDKAAGPSLISSLNEALANGEVVDSLGRPQMVVVQPLPANDQFEQRVDAITPTIEAGLVHLLDGASWLEEFVEEHGLWPNGLNDDRLDTLTHIILWAKDVDSSINMPGW